ncbi:MAG: hypothetical protein ACRD6X_02230, partial [Pyrinomonadaceae bacterium]
DGIVSAITFVPNDFRLMSKEELANARNVIIEGGPPTDLTANAERQREQQAEFEQKRREAMMRQIEVAMRQPQAGEIRVIGTVDKIECSGAAMSANLTTRSGPLKVKLTNPNELILRAFVPDAGGLRFGCGVSIPGLTAVITYLPSNDKKPKFAGELKALEFVPATFELP